MLARILGAAATRVLVRVRVGGWVKVRVGDQGGDWVRVGVVLTCFIFL
jgi:hypothetical protein